jgi:hypothetical protein
VIQADTLIGLHRLLYVGQAVLKLNLRGWSVGQYDGGAGIWTRTPDLAFNAAAPKRADCLQLL